jgi:hypothetical protein
MFKDKRQDSTTGYQQPTTHARSTASPPDRTTEMIYPSTTIEHESYKQSSAGVKYTSTKGDSSSLTTTTVTMQRSSGLSTEADDTTTKGDTSSKTTEHECMFKIYNLVSINNPVKCEKTDRVVALT